MGYVPNFCMLVPMEITDRAGPKELSGTYSICKFPAEIIRMLLFSFFPSGSSVLPRPWDQHRCQLSPNFGDGPRAAMSQPPLRNCSQNARELSPKARVAIINFCLLLMMTSFYYVIMGVVSECGCPQS